MDTKRSILEPSNERDRRTDEVNAERERNRIAEAERIIAFYDSHANGGQQ